MLNVYTRVALVIFFFALNQEILAGTISVEKKVTFRIDPKTTTGTAVLGPNIANDYSNNKETFDKQGPVNTAFSVSASGVSLPTTSLKAHEIGADATSSISVGKATAVANDPAGRLDIPATLNASVTIPEFISDVPALKGGKSEARARVNLNGVMTIDQLKVDQSVIIGAAAINNALSGLKSKGIYLDPLTYSQRNLRTGESVLETVFSADYSSGFGAGIGFNMDDRLELDAFNTNGYAELRMNTFVPWATNLTGSARLSGGIFEATGVLSPNSGLITDYWDLTEISPGYVINAILKPGILNQQIVLTPGALVAGDPTDLISYEIGTDLFAQIEVPEPPMIFLFSGALTLLIAFQRIKNHKNI